MGWKTMCLLFAGLALAACETPQDGSSAAAGSGSATPAGAGPSTDVASRSLSAAPRPGTQEDLVVNVGDRVFFEFDRYDLKPDARSVIEKQATWLDQNRQVVVTIAGHTDERGTREYNLALGEQRANSIRDYLVALGVDANRMKITSFGKERPVDPRSTGEAWSQNRRGVLVVD
jgi:peptidoglycan-associated lipoprotein